MMNELNPDDLSNIIIYLRKSRSDDPYMSVEEVLAKHETQLQEYAASVFGAPVPEEQIFREVVSGETIADRPVMKEVMKLLELGSIKGVLVIEPQRLSRGDLEDCGRIINVFRYTNTLVITPPKTYDLSNEYDRKFFEMELTRGNDYLEYTKKILNRGRIAAVKQGHFLGSIAPYGYKKITVGTGKSAYHTLEVIPEEAAYLRIMYDLYVNQGYGFTKIARHMDAIGAKPRVSSHWSAAAIKDILENPVYIGKIRWNWRKTIRRIEDGEIVKKRPKTKDVSDWIYVDGKHEAIIDDTTYAAALDRKGKNPCLHTAKELCNPFAGLLFCGSCGRGMSYKAYVKKPDYIVMLCNNQALCHTKSVQYHLLVNKVVKSLEKEIADFRVNLQSDTDQAEKLRADRIKALEYELKKLRERDSRQKDAYEDGVYTKEEYTQRNAKLMEKIEITRAALRTARAESLTAVNYAERIQRFQNALDALLDPRSTATEKNMLLKSCIDKIVYHNDNVSRPGLGRWVENTFSIDVYFKL